MLLQRQSAKAFCFFYTFYTVTCIERYNCDNREDVTTTFHRFRKLFNHTGLIKMQKHAETLRFFRKWHISSCPQWCQGWICLDPISKSILSNITSPAAAAWSTPAHFLQVSVPSAKLGCTHYCRVHKFTRTWVQWWLPEALGSEEKQDLQWTLM